MLEIAREDRSHIAVAKNHAPGDRILSKPQTHPVHIGGVFCQIAPTQVNFLFYTNSNESHLLDLIMPIFDSINSTLEADKLSWTQNARNIFRLGISLLKKRHLTRNKMTGEQAFEFSSIALGTLIYGLIYQNKDNKRKDYPVDETQIAQVLKEHRKLEVISQQAEPDVIQAIGEEVLNGRIDFNIEEYTKLFPEMSDFFSLVKKEKYKQHNYLYISSKFEEALNVSGIKTDEALKTAYRNAVIELRDHALKQFREEHPHFSYQRCLSLAEINYSLTNTLTIGKDDPEAAEAGLYFQRKISRVFDNLSGPVQVLMVIVGVIVGIVAGIVAGFFIAGPVGAAAGLGVGAVSGAVASSLLAVSLFAKKNPADKINDAAEKLRSATSVDDSSSKHEKVSPLDTENDSIMPSETQIKT